MRHVNPRKRMTLPACSFLLVAIFFTAPTAHAVRDCPGITLKEMLELEREGAIPVARTSRREGDAEDAPIVQRWTPLEYNLRGQNQRVANVEGSLRRFLSETGMSENGTPIERYLDRTQTLRIPQGSEEAYMRAFGENSIEVYSEGAHSALRIGNEVYHYYGDISVETYAAFAIRTQSYQVPGAVIMASEQERAFLRMYFRHRLDHPNTPYRNLSNTCSTGLCHAIEAAELNSNPAGRMAISPFMAVVHQSRGSRAAFKTLHHPEASYGVVRGASSGHRRATQAAVGRGLAPAFPFLYRTGIGGAAYFAAASIPKQTLTSFFSTHDASLFRRSIQLSDPTRHARLTESALGRTQLPPQQMLPDTEFLYEAFLDWGTTHPATAQRELLQTFREEVAFRIGASR